MHIHKRAHIGHVQSLWFLQVSDSAVDEKNAPYVRQSCDLEASGLEKLRRFAADDPEQELQPAPEDNSRGAANQHHSPKKQAQYTLVPLAQPCNIAGMLYLPSCG
jgi:hypothetical protein